MMHASLTPGFVVSYDRQSRHCRVRIPGITDGSDQFPEAEFCYAFGDKSEHTEVRILPGDRVWLAFNNGDTKHPVIMGWRPKRQGNVVNYRRWHHENIESDADQTQKHTAVTTYTIQVGDSTIVVEPAKVTVTTDLLVVDAPQSTFTGHVSIQNGLDVIGGAGGTVGVFTGNIQQTGDYTQVGNKTQTGNTTQTGNITATGDVVAGTISLKHHKHPDPQGGEVSEPT